MKLVQIGAGNIGRSFVTPLFRNAGWEVVLADVDSTLVAALNREGSYDVVVCDPAEGLRRQRVSGVRAIQADDPDALRRELSTADVVATSVGAAVLERVIESVLSALSGRETPVDILFAENAPGVSARARAGIERFERGALPPVGLVETSIGKMVPIVPEDVRAADPLQVRAEPYNTLICDKNGWSGHLPDVPGLRGVANIDAYVRRKLYVHNLGHSAVAYFGFLADPACSRISVAVSMSEVRAQTVAAMRRSVSALLKRYPDVFDLESLNAHVDDLLGRFENPYLGDTVYRVGRDLQRKLGPHERIIGAMRFCAASGVPVDAIAAVARAALGFRATDEHGTLFENDRVFLNRIAEAGALEVLRENAGLDEHLPEDGAVLSALASAFASDEFASEKADR